MNGGCRFDARTPAAWRALTWDVPSLGKWLALVFQANEQVETLHCPFSEKTELQ
jgi:hypothetical protein